MLAALLTGCHSGNGHGRAAAPSRRPPPRPISARTPPRRPLFGQFAGYLWPGHVHSVAASWPVPVVLAAAPHAVAATWIGVESESFIQIGTNELRDRTGAEASYAFWSDVAHHFLPVFLFRVSNGDMIAASIRRTQGAWRLTISDITANVSRSFAVPVETSGTGGFAEWLQEDPGSPHRRAVYPKLGDVEMRELEVNRKPVPVAQMESQWMTVNGATVGPSPIHQGSFELQPRMVTATGMRYLRAAARIDRVLGNFDGHLVRWTALTPHAVIARASKPIPALLAREDSELSATSWPVAVRSLVAELAQTNARLAAALAAGPGTGVASLSRWKSLLRRDDAAGSRVGQSIRHLLGLPGLSLSYTETAAARG